MHSEKAMRFLSYFICIWYCQGMLYGIRYAPCHVRSTPVGRHTQWCPVSKPAFCLFWLHVKIHTFTELLQYIRKEFMLRIHRAQCFKYNTVGNIHNKWKISFKTSHLWENTIERLTIKTSNSPPQILPQSTVTRRFIFWHSCALSRQESPHQKYIWPISFFRWM